MGEELREKGVYSLRGERLMDEKTIHALKKSHFMGHVWLDSILGSYVIPGIDFSPHKPSLNTGSEREEKSNRIKQIPKRYLTFDWKLGKGKKVTKPLAMQSMQ